MELIIETFKDFFGMVEGRFIIATTIMIIIALVVLYLLFLIAVSFRKRREAINVKLPDIDGRGEVVNETPSFTEKEEITVELIDSDEDEVSDTDVKTNEEAFLTALTIETGKFIADDNNNLDLKMPEVGEIDYDRIKEEKRKEKEQEVINRLREIAKADNQDDLDKVDNLGFNFETSQTDK